VLPLSPSPPPPTLGRSASCCRHPRTYVTRNRQLRHTVPHSSPRHLHLHYPSSASSLQIPAPTPQHCMEEASASASSSSSCGGEAARGVVVWRKSLSPLPEAHHQLQHVLVLRLKLVRRRHSKLARHCHDASGYRERRWTRSAEAHLREEW
jgi:hypothetical protein